MVTYGPRVNVHSDRIGADRASGVPMVKYLVVHTSEQSGSDDPDDAEDLANYLESPGDRPSSSRPGQYWGSSYHAITDSDRVLPAVHDYRVSYSAGGGNRYGLHICLPTRAGNSREDWLTGEARQYIRQCAAWIIDKCDVHGLPIQRLTPADLVDGASGYCGHVAISRAFNRSTHTDPGDQFPWGTLAHDIVALLTVPPVPTPSPEITMFRYRHTDYADQFVVGAGAIHMTPTALSLPAYADLEFVENADRDFLVHVCRVAQFDFADLTPM